MPEIDSFSKTFTNKRIKHDVIYNTHTIKLMMRIEGKKLWIMKYINKRMHRTYTAYAAFVKVFQLNFYFDDFHFYFSLRFQVKKNDKTFANEYNWKVANGLVLWLACSLLLFFGISLEFLETYSSRPGTLNAGWADACCTIQP